MSLLPSDYIISDDSEQESTEYYFYMFFRTSKVTILHSIDYSIESEKKKTKISSLGNIGSDVMPIAKIRKIKTDDKPKSIREVTEKQKPVTEEKKIEKVDDKVKETVEKKNSLKFILPKPKNSEYLEYTGASKEEKLEEVGEALLVEDKIEIEPEYKSSLPIPGKSKQLNYNSSYKSEIVENNYTVKNYKVDKHFRQFLSNEVEPICISQSELTDMSYNPFSATGTLYSEHDVNVFFFCRVC